MTNQIVLQNVWRLRTDPFYPEVDEVGVPIAKKAVERSLDPLVDERVVNFYFDVYDWTASHLVRDLSMQDALRIFPTERTLRQNGGLMVIMSGAMESGLDSLANLVLHKIRLTIGHMPIIVDGTLDSKDKVRNVAYIARRIFTKLNLDKSLPDTAGDIAKRMAEEYERVRKVEENRKDATYSELFESYHELLAPLDRKLVIKIANGGENDSWVRIYESSRSCCSFMIIMTSDEGYAKTCYESMIARNGNVAWIKAVPLDRRKAAEYLAHQLTFKRIPGAAMQPVEALLPFTSSAVDSLYEPGATGALRDTLTYPIGWLRRTFYQAFADQLEAVARTYANATPGALAAIDPLSTCIGVKEMRLAREKLNHRK